MPSPHISPTCGALAQVLCVAALLPRARPQLKAGVTAALFGALAAVQVGPVEAQQPDSASQPQPPPEASPAQSAPPQSAASAQAPSEPATQPAAQPVTTQPPSAPAPAERPPPTSTPAPGPTTGPASPSDGPPVAGPPQTPPASRLPAPGEANAAAPLAGQAPPPPPEPVAAPQASAPPQASEALLPVTPAAIDSGFFVAAGSAFGVRNLPSFSVGVALVGHVEPRGFVPIEFGASYFVPNHAELSDNALDLEVSPNFLLPYPPGGSRVRFDAMQAWGALCPADMSLAPGTLYLCAGGHFGLMSASSKGLMVPEDVSLPVAGFDAYARFTFPIARPFGISYALGLFVPVFRDSLRYVSSSGKEEEIFRLSPLGGRLDVLITFAP